MMRISGTPICLRAMDASDAAAWFSYLSMPHVIEHTSWNLAGVDELVSLIAANNAQEADACLRFAICTEADEKLIGTIGFHTVSAVNRTAELAYDLHPDYWRQGIASRCAQAVVQWGFAVQNYVRIQATVLPSNTASIGVLEKLGFTFEGVLRHYRIVRGEPRDYLMYSRLRDEA